MSQKSSLPQPTQSVSRVLTEDKSEAYSPSTDEEVAGKCFKRKILLLIDDMKRSGGGDSSYV
jgi:hypothetical protein